MQLDPSVTHNAAAQGTQRASATVGGNPHGISRSAQTADVAPTAATSGAAISAPRHAHSSSWRRSLSHRQHTAPASSTFPAKFDLSHMVSALNTTATSLRGLSHGSILKLGTKGRPMPPLTSQRVGMHFDAPVGEWGVERSHLVSAMLDNLTALNRLPEGPGKSRQQLQLHKELNLHWGSLCEAEKVKLVESLGTRHIALLGPLADDAAPTPVRDWLEHKVVNMPARSFERLRHACSDVAATRLQHAFDARARAAELTPRFKQFRCDLPVDHMYPYAAFLERTQRVVGELPADKKGKLEVCVVGGGPSGIVTADLLNRLDVKVTVLEQDDAIGGRMRDIEIDGNVFRPGAMRYAPDTTWMHFIEGSGLPLVPFPNVGDVTAMYLIGSNEPVIGRPGEPTHHALFDAVASEYKDAVAKVLEPIERARAAGDVATLQELWHGVREKFDGHTFRSGVEALLKENGVQWNEDKWNTFGVRGTGVGGYRGYFDRGFLSVVRFLADGRLANHRFLPGGSHEVLEHMVHNKDGLPAGAKSLAEQGSVVLNAEYTGRRENKDGTWSVSYRDKSSGGNVTRRFDAVFMAVPVPELRRLNETADDKTPGVMNGAVVRAVETVRIDSATKVMWPIPKERLEGKNHLPGNIQSSKSFAQLYILPPNDRSPDYQIHAYPLGDNSTRTHGYTKEDHVNSVIDTLRACKGDSAGSRAARELAELLVPDSMASVGLKSWGTERHFGGAFKMNAPHDTEHVDALWQSTRSVPDKGVFYVGEQFSDEDGFASGAAATSVNSVQSFVRFQGGTLPVNSPHQQEDLYRK